MFTTMNVFASTDPAGELGVKLVATVITLSIVVPALFLGFRPVDALVGPWAKAHGLDLDADARSLIADRLRRGRRIRTVGFAIGYSWPWAIFMATGNSQVFLRGIPPVQWSNLAGYFVAAVVAEVWFARASSPSGRAVLERRKLADYLPQPARLLPRCIAGTAAVLAVTYELLPYRPPHFEFSGERIAWRYYAGTGSHYRVSGAVAIGVVVVVELLQRAVVHRRQQYASESLLRADDSLRAWSLRILASVSITVTSTMVAFMLVPIGFKSGLVSLDGSFDALMSLAGLSPLVIALITFRSLSRPLSPWRVPRLRAVQPA